MSSATVCHIITGLGDGGAEAVLYRLCVAEAPTATRNRVISLIGAGRYGPLLAAAGVRVDCLDMSHGRLSLAGLLKLYRLLRDEPPDVVRTWMYHANLVGGVLARLAGISNVIWSIHSSFLDPTASRSARLADWLCARLSPFVPRVIVNCSRRGAEVCRKSGYSARKLVVIPNGYDVARFSPDLGTHDAMRAELGVSTGTFLIGMVARSHPVKDHPNLLRALAHLGAANALDWRCVLVGTGMTADNAALTGRIAELGLVDKVDLAGPRDDIPRIMNALDLHVLSSIAEGFPNAVAEAMACGTPCVVTDVGDAADIVGDTGWIVPVADSSALAGAIATAIVASDDAPAWKARQIAARARIVDRFSLPRMIEAYARVAGIDLP